MNPRVDISAESDWLNQLQATEGLSQHDWQVFPIRESRGRPFMLQYGSGLTNVFEADTGLSDTTEGSNTVLALSHVGRNHT